MQMPSGSKIIVGYYAGYMNLDIYVSSRLRTEGLCGSFDGNPDNDIKHRFTGRTARTVVIVTEPSIDGDVANSWR